MLFRFPIWPFNVSSIFLWVWNLSDILPILYMINTLIYQYHYWLFYITLLRTTSHNWYNLWATCLIYQIRDCKYPGCKGRVPTCQDKLYIDIDFLLINRKLSVFFWGFNIIIFGRNWSINVLHWAPNMKFILQLLIL